MKKIGTILIENRLLTQEQLNNALGIQKGMDKKKPLGEILIDLDYITFDILLEYLDIQIKNH